MYCVHAVCMLCVCCVGLRICECVCVCGGGGGVENVSVSKHGLDEENHHCSMRNVVVLF